MHLAIDAREPSVAVQHNGGVVVHTRATALEHGTHDHQAQFRCQPTEPLGGRAGDRFGAVEPRRFLSLAKIVAVVQFLEQNEAAPSVRRLPTSSLAGSKIAGSLSANSLLDQCDA